MYVLSQDIWMNLLESIPGLSGECVSVRGATVGHQVLRRPYRLAVVILHIVMDWGSVTVH